MKKKSVIVVSLFLLAGSLSYMAYVHRIVSKPSAPRAGKIKMAPVQVTSVDHSVYEGSRLSIAPVSNHPIHPLDGIGGSRPPSQNPAKIASLNPILPPSDIEPDPYAVPDLSGLPALSSGKGATSVTNSEMLSFDDYGMPYTGSLRLNGQLNLGNLLAKNDQLVFVLTSSWGYNSASMAYSFPITDMTTMNFGYSAYSYTVGNGWSPISSGVNQSAVKALGASGYGQDISAGISQKIIKREHTDLGVKVQFDEYILSDTYNRLAGRNNNRVLNAVTVSLPFMHETKGNQLVLNLSYEYYNMAQSGGSSTVGNPFATAPENVGIWRLYSADTTKLPGENNSLYIYLSGLFSTGILDPTQEISLGGYSSVRGFQEAAVFGNDGYSATAEFRHVLSHEVFGGHLMLRGFFDAGAISLGNNTNYLTIMSPGIGFLMDFPDKITLNFDIGTPIGPIPGVIGSVYPVQAWFSLGKQF